MWINKHLKKARDFDNNRKNNEENNLNVNKNSSSQKFSLERIFFCINSACRIKISNIRYFQSTSNVLVK